MNAQELTAGRAALRGTGEVTQPVQAELRSVARWLVYAANLPSSLSPYGRWDEEAVGEILQGWYEERLLRGHLQGILDRARTPDAFRRLARRSLRQWLLNQRQRSYSQNLFARVRALLEGGPPFVQRQSGTRPQDSWWTLETAADAPLFARPERELLSAAWGLGDFELLRYTERHKLSPLLSHDDLVRFVVGLLTATGEALTLGMISRALRDRFGLDDLVELPLDDPGEGLVLASPDAVAERVVLREQAKAAADELTPRQIDVLLGTRAGETMETLASRHGCAIATIYNEQRRVAKVVERLSENASERDELLKTLSDLLYERT